MYQSIVVINIHLLSQLRNHYTRMVIHSATNNDYSTRRGCVEYSTSSSTTGTVYTIL